MLSPGGSLLAGRMTPALLGGHLPDDQSALLDLLPDGIELLFTFLLLTFPLCCPTHLHQEYSRHKAASAIIRRGAAEARMLVICRCGTLHLLLSTRHYV